jgi:hypothetical protein
MVRDRASAELGSHGHVLGLHYYGGVCVPPYVKSWRREVERQPEVMEGAKLTRPAKPRPAGAPQPPRVPLGIDGPY